MVACKVNLELIQKDVDKNLEIMNLPTTQSVAGTAAMTWVMIDRIDKALTLAASPNQALQMTTIARAGTVAGGLYASYWAGAVIGSIANAIYKNTECSQSQVMAFAKDSGISVGWLQATYARHPELLNAR